MVTTTRIILNGKGGANPAVREAIECIRNQGQAIAVRATWEGRDATRYVQEVLTDPVDIFVVGNGTVNEVVNGLFARHTSSDVKLGIPPLGAAIIYTT